MTTVTVNYGAKTTITCGLATTPLASSANLNAGRESDQIDNSTNKFDDALVEGMVTVGTTPTTNTSIIVYAWGSNESLATTAKDVLDGTDSDETITSAGVAAGFLKRVATMKVDSNTSNRAYYFGVDGIAQYFGGVLPKYWGLFVSHNTGVALNSTAGNHAVNYIGIKYDNA